MIQVAVLLEAKIRIERKLLQDLISIYSIELYLLDS